VVAKRGLTIKGGLRSINLLPSLEKFFLFGKIAIGPLRVYWKLYTAFWKGVFLWFVSGAHEVTF
jgi:hypothetical protein